MLGKYRGFLFDLDGTLMAGRRALPGAAELMRALDGRFVVVSNDSEHIPEQLAGVMRGAGLPIGEDRLILSGIASLDFLERSWPGARLHLIGSVALARDAERRGFLLTDSGADIVLIARDRNFTYETLAAAARNVHDGANVVVASPDRSHPGIDGYPVPEAGALAAAILSIGERREPIVVGNPEPTLFRMACAKLDLDPCDCLMIGDNPLTDGEGAARSGMTFLHVAPGDLPALAVHPDLEMFKRG